MGALVEVVKQHYANMSSGEWERDREIMSSEVVTVDPSGTLTGLDAFLAHEAVFATAFPDARADLIRAVEAGDTVMTEGVFSGTHTGPLARFHECRAGGRDTRRIRKRVSTRGAAQTRFARQAQPRRWNRAA